MGGTADLRPKYQYRVLSRLGEGGMGDVFLAEIKSDQRRVAMKVLKRDFSSDPEIVERFLREARATADIDHPNIVDILDVGRSRAGQVFFVMEHLDGDELGRLLAKTGRLPWYRARGILIQLTQALGAAHARGVIHRDMKPDNVFVLQRPERADHVKVLDFGIAKIEGAEALTQAGMVFGTAGYMAPEQVMGAKIDARADIYALGCMAFEILCGRLPFVDRSPMRLLNMHLREPAPSARQLAPDAGIPEGVDAMLLRALEKQPDDRFADMAEFERALLAIPAGPAPAPSHVGTPTPVANPAVDVARAQTQMHGSASAADGSPRAQVPAPRQAQATQFMSSAPKLGDTAEPAGPPPVDRAATPAQPNQTGQINQISQTNQSGPRPMRMATASTGARRPRRRADVPPPAPAPARPDTNLDAGALATVYVGLGFSLAGSPGALGDSALIDQLRRWDPGTDGRAVLEGARAQIVALPADRQGPRYAEALRALAGSGPAATNAVALDLFTLSYRGGTPPAPALQFVLEVARHLGQAPGPLPRAAGIVFVTLARAGGEVDEREIRFLGARLRRWHARADERGRELAVRFALAELDLQPDLESQWRTAYEAAEAIARASGPAELHPLMCDLWAIADADGEINPAERELVSEVSRRYVGATPAT